MGDLVLYRRLLRQARTYWLHCAALLAVGLLASPVALLNPLPLKIVVDSVLGTRPLPAWLGAVLPARLTGQPGALLLVAVGLLVLITLLGQVRALTNAVLRTYVSERLVLAVRAQIVHQMQRLSLTYHDSRGTADSIYRIQHDAPALQQVIVEGVIPFVSAAIMVTTMVWATARLDGSLALVALAVAPPLFVLGRIYRPRMRQQSRTVKRLESAALAVVQETLGALRVVKAFGQEPRETARFVRRSNEGMGERIRLALLERSYGLCIALTTSFGVAAVLLVGVGHVRAGVLTLGQLLMVLGYLAQLYEPLKTMSKRVASLQGQLASAERVFALLDERPDVPERPNAQPLVRAAGSVAFREVSFAYGPDRPVLDHVSFEVQPGRRVGVVGATGAGKSTLISLLMRFYDPTGGRILLDGVDLRDYRLDHLRRQFAVVPQEPVLFSVSVGENIAYAAPDASRDAIVAAARAANAHQFIERLPQGYDTPVGERGSQLSGGQRQRIALARAFLKDAPLLVLDEPTSSVDQNTESVILEAMDRLMEGRTAFLITHRPSALTTCDARLHLERGRLVEEAAVHA